MRVIGIDVGLGGGIAWIDDDGSVEVREMPIYNVRRGTSTKRNIDKAALADILQQASLDGRAFAFVEKQRAFPSQGVVSVFRLGWQEGVIIGMLTALGVQHESIHPQVWQRHFSIVRSTNTKFSSYERASSLFPNLRLKTERGRILDGLCDAVLIAEFGRRRILSMSEYDDVDALREKVDAINKRIRELEEKGGADENTAE